MSRILIGILTLVFFKMALAQADQMPVCPGGTPSEAVVKSIPHILGFTEVREFVQNQKEEDLKPCYVGLTLQKNQFQYYKNLIFFKFYDESGALQKMTTSLFQVSSIQGHHSPEGRPWVVLDSQQVLQQILQPLVGETQVTAMAPTGAALLKEEWGPLVSESLMEPSSLFLYSADGVDHYLVSWLKEVTSAQAGLYTKEVSPRWTLVKKESESGKVEVQAAASAFYSVLIPSEKLLKTASDQAWGMTGSQKKSFIETMSQLSR